MSYISVLFLLGVMGVPSYVINHEDQPETIVVPIMGEVEVVEEEVVVEKPHVPTVIDKIEQDGINAIQIAQAIKSLNPNVKDEELYTMAFSFARWTRHYELDQWHIIAKTFKESRFNPRAKSPTNDHGLMQLHRRPIYDIDANIMAGCCHFWGNLKSANGNYRLASARYNGGTNPPAVSFRYADSIISHANTLRAKFGGNTNGNGG